MSSMSEDDKEWIEILRDTGYEVQQTLKWALNLMKEYDRAMVDELGANASLIYSPQHIDALGKAETLLSGISGAKTLEAFNLSRLRDLIEQYDQLQKKVKRYNDANPG